ncbi:oxidoreductase [Anaerobacillus alkaliphilus]|uniref:Oxidoreductase n=1 Tax=Anaerobacillus alkaliphilus TaxID=1548597 RepID=A0A4Q0VWK0_9BACI|nr:oxidoreductase [Anaerobacillus alkaliphilus]RXJ04093.1 oxidoreductase [Anaerobacillus alkaliphilus]
MKSVLIIGATGLVGGHLLDRLLQSGDYGRVVTVTRRPLEIIHDKLEQHVINFDELAQHQDIFAVDTVFCTLGTTMKQAKTKEQFVKVDFDYPLQVAKLAKEKKVNQFFIVTAMGANQHSRFFYNQVKGNVEAAIQELSIPVLYIIRPSLLLGDRNEARFGEDLGQKVTKVIPYLFKGPLQRFKPNEASSVASAMLNLSLKNEEGTHVIESKMIEQYK